MKVSEFFERYFCVRTCVGCGERMGYEYREEAFCDACRIDFERAKTVSCPECFASMSECRCIPKPLLSAGVIEYRKLVAYLPSGESNPENKLLYFLKRNKNKRVALFVAKQLVYKLEEMLAANGILREDVVLTSTGTKFANFGALTIKSNGEVEFELINPDSVDIDAMSASGKEAYTAVKSKVDGYNAQIEDLYGKIGTSEAELVVSDSEGWLVRKQETNMGNFVTDAYRYVTGADVAICNGGGVRSAITVGDVSKI